MKKLKSGQYETATARFMVDVYESVSSGSFTAEYSGHQPKLAPMSGTSAAIQIEIGRGKVSGASMDEALAKLDAAIEALGESITERDLRDVQSGGATSGNA